MYRECAKMRALSLHEKTPPFDAYIAQIFMRSKESCDSFHILFGSSIVSVRPLDLVLL